ncbi:MAG: sugar phosphate isomerase/epimerase, partial [Mesorhizobium sp.]
PTSFTLEGDYSIDSGARIRRDLARLKTLIARSMWSGGSDGTGCENGSGVAKTEGTVFPSVYR